jgi:hypothetical protein
MTEQNPLGAFEQTVLPHLDAAYNLARWLARQRHSGAKGAGEATAPSS